MYTDMQVIQQVIHMQPGRGTMLLANRQESSRYAARLFSVMKFWPT